VTHRRALRRPGWRDLPKIAISLHSVKLRIAQRCRKPSPPRQRSLRGAPTALAQRGDCRLGAAEVPAPRVCGLHAHRRSAVGATRNPCHGCRRRRLTQLVIEQSLTQRMRPVGATGVDPNTRRPEWDAVASAHAPDVSGRGNCAACGRVHPMRVRPPHGVRAPQKVQRALTRVAPAECGDGVPRSPRAA
jgi:hypothetical protein